MMRPSTIRLGTAIVLWLCLSALARVDAMGLAQQTAQKTPAGQAPDQSRPPLTPEELATQERLEVEVKTREQALRTVKTEIDRLSDDLTETRAAYESRKQDAPDCDANALSLVYFLFGAGAWPEDSASERAFELFRVTQIRLERAREAELEPAEALRLARARLDNFRLTRSATAASLSGTDEKFDRELRKNEERRSLEKQKEDQEQEQEQKKTPQPISRATDVRLPSTVASFALSDPCPAPVQVLSAIPAGNLPSGLGSFVNINGGGEVGGTDNLFIRSDSGDFVDLFNGRLVNQRTVENTASAQNSLVFREELRITNLTLESGAAVGRFAFAANGSVGRGTQELTFRNAAGNDITTGGDVASWRAGGNVRAVLMGTAGGRVFYLNSRVRGGRDRVRRGTRRPALAVNGGSVTSELNGVDTTRFAGGVVAGVETDRLDWWGGFNYIHYRFKRQSELAFDFSQSVPGVSQQAVTRTSLEKNGAEAVGGATWFATRRLGVAVDASLGRDTWAVRAGLRVRVLGARPQR